MPSRTTRLGSRKLLPIAQSFAGHQSVNVIKPHAAAEPYTIVLHFDTIANLRKWLNSDTRRRLVDTIKPYLHRAEDVDIRTGFEFWFTRPPSPSMRGPGSSTW